MNKFKKKILNIKFILPVFLLTVFIWVGMGEVVHAQGIEVMWQLLTSDGNVLFTGILAIMASLSYSLSQIASFFLTICGTLLNVGLQLTVHLDIFLRNNEIIYTVWSTIRDLSSMLLIFFILQAAIQMILGKEQAGYGNLIKNIIIAGVLINFSFFFTRVLIDASNIVSLQFYNAMAPTNDVQYLPNDTFGTVISKTIKNGSGGISGIFTGALGVNQWWSDKSVFKAASFLSSHNTDLLTGIFIANQASIMVQILAGLSLLAAAVAVLWRSIILIFLIGFSPIWIASYAMPQLKDFRDEWMGPFKANLIFLPVYMVFMYVSVLIISKSNLNSLVVNISNSSGNSMDNYLRLLIAFAIIILMLNIPLIVALRASKLKLKWVESIKGSMESFTKWATLGVATSASGWAGRNTLGRGASSVDKWAGNQKFNNPIAKTVGSLVGIGNSDMARTVRSGTVGKIAQSKFGTSRSWKDQTTVDKEIAKKDKEIETFKNFNMHLQTTNMPGIKDSLGKMNGKQKLDLGFDTLNKIEVIKHLKEDDFEAIKKSDDFTDEEKKAISDNRIVALNDSITKGEKDITKHMVGNMSGKDLMKPGISLTDNNIVEHLKNSQLKVMEDEGLDTPTKKIIGTKINDDTIWGGVPHKAKGFVGKNHLSWL